LTSAAVVVVPGVSRADSPGWLLQCPLAKTAAVDPIVHPRMSGMSHLHDFFANTSVDAASTYRSMRAGATTCPAGDTAGYWVPALFRNGVKVDPAGNGVRQQIYFRGDNLVAGTHIEPFPPDLRMIAGEAGAASTAGNPKLGKEIYWGCSDNSTGKLTTPPRSCPTGFLSLHVGFPNCWDGTLTHVNDTPHLRYPSDERCPVGFSRALPRIILRLEYPVGPYTGNITLASGPAYTAHGDFWNTWDQVKLQTLVDRCLNTGTDCGTFAAPGRPAPHPSVGHRIGTTSVSATARPHSSSSKAPASTQTTSLPEAVGAPSPTTGPPPIAETGSSRPFAATTGLLGLAVGVLAGTMIRRSRTRRVAGTSDRQLPK
jgi:hypothetical protein